MIPTPIVFGSSVVSVVKAVLGGALFSSANTPASQPTVVGLNALNLDTSITGSSTNASVGLEVSDPTEVLGFNPDSLINTLATVTWVVNGSEFTIVQGTVLNVSPQRGRVYSMTVSGNLISKDVGYTYEPEYMEPPADGADRTDYDLRSSLAGKPWPMVFGKAEKVPVLLYSADNSASDAASGDDVESDDGSPTSSVTNLEFSDLMQLLELAYEVGDYKPSTPLVIAKTRVDVIKDAKDRPINAVRTDIVQGNVVATPDALQTLAVNYDKLCNLHATLIKSYPTKKAIIERAVFYGKLKGTATKAYAATNRTETLEDEDGNATTPDTPPQLSEYLFDQVYKPFYEEMKAHFKSFPVKWIAIKGDLQTLNIPRTGKYNLNGLCVEGRIVYVSEQDVKGSLPTELSGRNDTTVYPSKAGMYMKVDSDLPSLKDLKYKFERLEGISTLVVYTNAPMENMLLYLQAADNDGKLQGHTIVKVTKAVKSERKVRVSSFGFKTFTVWECYYTPLLMTYEGKLVESTETRKRFEHTIKCLSPSGGSITEVSPIVRHTWLLPFLGALIKSGPVNLVDWSFEFNKVMLEPVPEVLLKSLAVLGHSAWSFSSGDPITIWTDPETWDDDDVGESGSGSYEPSSASVTHGIFNLLPGSTAVFYGLRDGKLIPMAPEDWAYTSSAYTGEVCSAVKFFDMQGKGYEAVYADVTDTSCTTLEAALVEMHARFGTPLPTSNIPDIPTDFAVLTKLPFEQFMRQLMWEYGGAARTSRQFPDRVAVSTSMTFDDASALSGVIFDIPSMRGVKKLDGFCTKMTVKYKDDYYDRDALGNDIDRRIVKEVPNPKEPVEKEFTVTYLTKTRAARAAEVWFPRYNRAWPTDTYTALPYALAGEVGDLLRGGLITSISTEQASILVEVTQGLA